MNTENKGKYIGMGMDEAFIVDKYGLDSNKKRNHRGRSRFSRRVRYFLNKERMIVQMKQSFATRYSYLHRN